MEDKHKQLVLKLPNSISFSKLLHDLFLLLPFICILIAEAVAIQNEDIGSAIKAGVVLYMFLFVVARGKFPNMFFKVFLLFLPFFIWSLFVSFDYRAALSEGFRYLFPLIALVYGYAIRKKAHRLILYFIFFVVLNDLWQIINYINWSRGVTQWFYRFKWDGNRGYFQSNGMIRATGLVVFFGLFGFINLIAFFITKQFYKGKQKKFLLWLFAISIFLSFSYKTIGAFLAILFFESKNKLKLVGGMLVTLIAAILIIPKQVVVFWDNLVLRVKFYITEGNSARAESYRVMFEDIKEFNLLGRGIGSFGGPSSVAYNSPVYGEVGYDWYETPHLTTTDTYFPHLFVEMGLFGGLAYLLVIFSPVILRVRISKKIQVVYYIYFAMIFDALFSYALNNLSFVLVSLVWIYPLLYLSRQKSVYDS
ncbi:O-antigen ligase family protein [Allomuricauda sp. d1]|uniref:O-antigen ligase family protein n=1 Tax=Allomuricauda sp. d1 TaxID=3136725 RepID=UPI0031D717BD